MSETTSLYSLRTNPVFWLMWLLPGAAVAAGFATLAIALNGADHALPATFHWEGDGLDRDFARAAHAEALGISVSLELRAGSCVAVVRNVSAETATLELELVNGANAALDRYVTLARSGANEFRAECPPLPQGRWWVGIAGEQGDWSLRERFDGMPATIGLGPRVARTAP